MSFKSACKLLCCYTRRSVSGRFSQRLVGMQGVFRGVGDTKTPLLATVVSNALNVLLDPIFIFALRWGVVGAALATVTSQATTSASCIHGPVQ